MTKVPRARPGPKCDRAPNCRMASTLTMDPIPRRISAAYGAGRGRTPTSSPPPTRRAARSARRFSTQLALRPHIQHRPRPSRGGWLRGLPVGPRGERRAAIARLGRDDDGARGVVAIALGVRTARERREDAREGEGRRHQSRRRGKAKGGLGFQGWLGSMAHGSDFSAPTRHSRHPSIDTFGAPVGLGRITHTDRGCSEPPSPSARVWWHGLRPVVRVTGCASAGRPCHCFVVCFAARVFSGLRFGPAFPPSPILIRIKIIVVARSWTQRARF